MTSNLCVFITAKRPPVEETASFLQSLLASHGPNYLEKLFGQKARDALSPLGGVEKVAIALSGMQIADIYAFLIPTLTLDSQNTRAITITNYPLYFPLHPELSKLLSIFHHKFILRALYANKFNLGCWAIKKKMCF